MDTGASPKYWNEEQCRYAESPFRWVAVIAVKDSGECCPASEGMVATLEAVWEAGHAVFGPACYHHGLITEHGWSSLKVGSLRGGWQA